MSALPSASFRHPLTSLPQNKIANILMNKMLAINVRSVAYKFGQFSPFSFILNYISYKELQTFLNQVRVSKTDKKQMLYANCLPT